jgi:dinuclear metal center YbgI/SA1388 family protein
LSHRDQNSAPTRDLIGDLDALLEPDRYGDYGPNGLQVPGPDEIVTLITGVSAHVELFERAAELGADLVLTHHGILWDRAPRRIDAALKRRLQLLFDHDMALAAYHLPLDGHLEVGNNALLAQGLGASAIEPFGRHGAATIGVAARFADPIPRDEILARTEQLCGQAPLAFPFGPDPVASIGIVSGAGSDYLVEAADRGLDAFLTGEPTERAMADARERGLTYIAAGHYATEVLGVRGLGERLAAKFNVVHTFVQVSNPV